MKQEKIDSIKALIQEGDKRVAEARRPHLENVGEMLFEARSQLTHGEFVGWIRRNFKMTERQANEYMDMAIRARNRRVD